ncbi:MAG TPA: hypothetical protein PLU17_02570 [Chitinophagaceae bacterium]|nr:hypothetical protein [Chitinophagaceae bacterium]
MATPLRKILVLAIASIGSLFVKNSILHAQEKTFVINSGDIIKEGIQFHDNEKYKSAIAEYQKVPENDTNYGLALFELSLSARVDSQYALAKDAARRALDITPNDNEHDLLLQLGSTYDDEKNYDSATIIFNKAIEKYPNSFRAYHSKGINLYLKKQYDSAYKYFEKVVYLNPYAFNSHYFLGMLAKEKGYPIQSMMSFAMCLMLSPGSSRAGQCITSMYHLANLSDTTLKNFNNRKEESFFKEDYSEIETYFKSKIALEPKYKIQTPLNEAVFKQLNLICEKLPSAPNNPNDLWASYYAPIFKTLFDKNLFGGATVIMVSGIQNNDVKKLLKEYKKEMEAAGNLANDKLVEIGYHGSTNRASYKDEPGYVFENSLVLAKGKYLSPEKKVLHGEWIFYNKVGDITSVINYNTGKLNGPYKAYYDNGNLKTNCVFENEKVKGEIQEYYNNGLMKTNATIINEKRENLYTEYYINGSKALVENYKDGKREGKSTIYYESGEKHYELKYENNLAEGLVNEYADNGKLLSTTYMKKGKAEGEKIVYHPNQTIRSKGNMVDGEREGLFISYFNNGIVSAKEIYKKGKLDGNCTYYHKNGKEKISITYEKGVQEGSSSEKDEEGRLVYIDEYKNGHLKKVTYYNILTNQIIKENVIDDKQKNMIYVYDAIGNLNKEAVCNRDGMYNGETKTYYTGGQLKSKKLYEKGNANGVSYQYHQNGKTKVEEYYTDDQLNGLYTSYHENGKIQGEGKFEKGEKQGYWYYYDNQGYIYKMEYFINGNKHGVLIDYAPNGKIKEKNYWYFGEQVRSTKLDTMGKIIHDQVFKLGENNEINEVNSIGIKQRTASMKNNYLQGIETNYYPNQKIQSIVYFKNGNIDSTANYFYSNGKKRREGNFNEDNQEGVWKSYDRNGNLSSINHFENDESNGIDTFYENKILDVIISYKDDERHGWLDKYIGGEYAHSVHYYEGLIIGYTYLLPDGNKIKEIPVENSNKLVTLTSYYKNGKKAIETGYQNGDYQGRRTLYFPNEKIHYETNYIDGEINGDEKEYFANGQLNYLKHYINGEKDGVQKVYNEKGILVEEENFINGYQHGTTKYYDDNGNIKQTITYYWGEILKIEG